MKALLAFALLIWSASQASAIGMCGPRDGFVKSLANKYQEHAGFIAVAGGGVLILEVFVSKSGTWTMLTTTQDKVTCVFAAGDSWQALPAYIEEKKT